MIIYREILKMNEIVFKLGESDINILDKKNLSFSFLDKKNRTFIKHSPSKLGLDLLFIGLITSFIDKNLLRDNSTDGWTRDIKVVFPVLEDNKWKGKEELIAKLLSFLSGDNWVVSFSKRSLTDFEKAFLKRKYVKKTVFNEKDIKRISMFSGGLDSFIGAIDLLNDNADTVFVNIHGGGNSFVQNFEYIRDALCLQYNIQNKNILFRTFYVSPKKGKEDTTRARSFTFFTHALALSTCFTNIKELIIPENGTISLNVPLTIGRYGSCSTRTTHPYYISLLKELINGLGLQLEIKNPYQFFTKGEMIVNCKNRTLLDENISRTMSCSHPTSGRWHEGDGSPKHCGYCLPCLIRRAAEYKAYSQFDVTNYREPLRKTKQNQSTIKCLLLRISTYSNGLAPIEIQKNGTINNFQEKYVDLYKRSIDELKDFIDAYSLNKISN